MLEKRLFDADELAELDRTLARLGDCDLSQWDRDFVDDMVKRLGRYRANTHVSGKQWEQLERMKEQYL